MQLLSIEEIKEYAGLITLLAGVVAIFWKPIVAGIRIMITTFKNLKTFSTNINKTITQVEELYPLVLKLNEDLKPNGGSSLRDAIDRIDRRVALSEQRSRYFAEHPGEISFETDADGNTIWVSKGWQETYGLSSDDAIGRGWINGVYIDDREDVVKEWYNAVKDKRRFEMTYRVNRDHPMTVFCESYPLVSPKGQIVGWLGYVRREYRQLADQSQE